MRSSALLFIAGVAACASSGTSSEQPVTPQTTRVVGSSSVLSVTTTTTSSAITGEVPFPIEKVWAILPSVYDSLGVAPSEVNASTRVVAKSSFKARRRLGDVSLARILDCGTTQGGPSAETYEIVMSIRTRVQPAGAGASTLSTEIEASGKPVSSAGEYVRCTSRATLEQRILDTVKRRLSG